MTVTKDFGEFGKWTLVVNPAFNTLPARHSGRLLRSCAPGGNMVVVSRAIWRKRHALRIRVRAGRRGGRRHVPGHTEAAARPGGRGARRPGRGQAARAGRAAGVPVLGTADRGRQARLASGPAGG